MMLLTGGVIKVHARLGHRSHWMVGTTLVIRAKFRRLVLAIVGFELTGHGCGIRVRALLPAVVTITLLVLLCRSRIARGGRCLTIVSAACSHCGYSILEQASINVLITHQLLMNGWECIYTLGR